MKNPNKKSKSPLSPSNNNTMTSMIQRKESWKKNYIKRIGKKDQSHYSDEKEIILS
jgi:hypothetical protein